MSISLEKLQQDWQQVDRKINSLLKINTEILQELVANQGKSVTRKYSYFLTFDFLFNIALYLITLQYLGRHFGQWSLFLPIFSLHLLLTLSLIRIAWVYVINVQTDWQMPVVVIKRRYAEIGRITRLFALCAFWYFTVMHTPLLFWLVEQTLGYNMYTDPDNLISDGWIISQWVFTTALGITAFLLIINRHKYPWVERIIADSAGFAFLQVDRELKELKGFEVEQQ